MAEQLPGSDLRGTTIRQSWSELGQPALDAVVETEQALCHQYQCRRGDNRLADRSQPENRVQGHRPRLLSVGKTRGLLVDQFTVARDQHDDAYQPPLFQCLLDDGLNTGRQMCWQNALAQGKDGMRHRKFLS